MSTKEDPKVSVTVVGPGLDYYGDGSFDSDSRRVVVTIEVQADSAPSSGCDRFQLESSTSRYNGKWTEPYLWPFRWEVLGRSIDLEEAEHVTKRLTAFRRYVVRLPYPPRTLGDYLSALFAFLKVGTMKYFHYPDQKSRPDRHEEQANAAFVAYQVEAAYRELQQLNSV